MVLTTNCQDVPLSNSQNDIVEKHAAIPEWLQKLGCTVKCD